MWVVSPRGKANGEKQEGKTEFRVKLRPRQADRKCFRITYTLIQTESKYVRTEGR